MDKAQHLTACVLLYLVWILGLDFCLVVVVRGVAA